MLILGESGSKVTECAYLCTRPAACGLDAGPGAAAEVEGVPRAHRQRRLLCRWEMYFQVRHFLEKIEGLRPVLERQGLEPTRMC